MSRKVTILAVALMALSLGIGGALAGPAHQLFPGAKRPAPNARKKISFNRLHSLPLRATSSRPSRVEQTKPRVLSGAALTSELTALAVSIGGQFGDAAPVSAQWVRTTRQAANAADNGDRVDTNEPVYYVVLHGNFAVGKAGYVNPGATPPTGHILGFTVDAATNEVLDVSVSNNPRDIATLGTPASLHLP